jgi:D-inositol-3-phosphate glycosyltransferase
MGVNFEEFIPGKKIEARKALNLPIESKILLFIGKLDRYKGSDKLIEAYQILKNKYNLSLVIVGASELDEYYKRAIRCGVIIFPRQPHKNLQQFYQSADIFILPGSKQYNRWGGIGINTIEALACNIPVITGTLNNFPVSSTQVGILANNVSDIINATEFILKNPDKFNKCRDLAQKYFDWKPIIDNTYQIYKDLFNKYYDIKLVKANEQ